MNEPNLLRYLDYEIDLFYPQLDPVLIRFMYYRGQPDGLQIYKAVDPTKCGELYNILIGVSLAKYKKNYIEWNGFYTLSPLDFSKLQENIKRANNLKEFL